MYDLSRVLETDAVTDIRPGTSLLVAGPPMTGKERLAMQILTDGSRAGEGALVVSTGSSAATVVDDYRERVDDVQDLKLAVVDCRSEGSGMLRDDPEESADLPGLYVHHASSPGDLTSIGIGITEGLDSLRTAGAERGRFALISLSTMLTYTDRETVFKFCHVLSSRLEGAGYLGVFIIDTGAHDEQTIQVVKQAFDGLLEVREADGENQARVVGLGRGPSDWFGI